NIHGPVPEGHYTVPLGQSRKVREGRDVTIVGLSYATLDSLKAVKEMTDAGIDPEIIDVRTLSPRDDSIILESVRKTGHLVVVDQGSMTCGYAGDIVASVVEKEFKSLKSAPERVTLPDIPTPTTRALANFFYPTPRHIANAARKTLGMKIEQDGFAGI